MGIDSLSKRYNLKSIIEFRDANMYNVATNSPTGKISGLYRLKGFIIDNLLDSLKQNKRIVQYIYPPKSPSIDLSNLHTYYRGNLQSKVSIIIYLILIANLVLMLTIYMKQYIKNTKKKSNLAISTIRQHQLLPK